MFRAPLRLLALVAGVACASAAQADTLADTLTLAYRNSGLLDQNRALLRAADEDVALAVSALRPIVNWSANIKQTRVVANYDAGSRVVPDGRGGAISVNYGSGANVTNETTANIGISASLLLYDFGASQYGIDAAKELVLATRQGLISAEQNVLLRAVQAHMEVRRALEVLELRRSNVGLIQQELRAARDRFEVGEITRTDVSFAEARLAEARAQVAAAEGDLARAREEYRAVTGQAPNRLSSGTPARIRQTEDQAIAIALRNHPAIIEVQHNVAAAELNIKRAEAAMKPRAQLDAQMGVDQDWNMQQSLGLSVSGPIYQGGGLSSRVRQAMARRDANRAGLHTTSAAIRQQVSSAYAIMQVTKLSIEASDTQVRAARTAFEGIREEAGLGSRTTLDVLDAEQSLLNARVGVVSAQIDQVIASYNTLASMGQLTAQALQLPVQQYDPTAYYKLVEGAPTARSEQGRALDRVLRSIGD